MSHYESIAPAVEPHSVKYYHGRITRNEAERRLRLAHEGSADGLYLIRDHLHQDGFFVLSLFHHGAGITHYVIERNFSDGSVSVSGSARNFAGPVELVNYYCFHSSELACRLQNPCPLQRGATVSYFSGLSPETMIEELISIGKKYKLGENDIKRAMSSYRRPEFEKLMRKFVYQNRDWFHGVISKKEVDRRLKQLKQDGTYLVWIKPNTTTHYLSLCYRGSIFHYKIRMDTILSQVSIKGRGKEYFDSLIALVDYHEKVSGNLAHVLVEPCVVDSFGERSMEDSPLPSADQLNQAFKTILAMNGDYDESLYRGRSLKLLSHQTPEHSQSHPVHLHSSGQQESVQVENRGLSLNERKSRPSISSTDQDELASSSPVPVPDSFARTFGLRLDSTSSSSKSPFPPARTSPTSHTYDYQSTASSGDSLSGDLETRQKGSDYGTMPGSSPWKDKRELMHRWGNVISRPSPVTDRLKKCVTEEMLGYFTRMKIADEEQVRQHFRRGKTIEAAELLLEKLSHATDVQFIHDLARALHENDHTDIWQDLKAMLMERSGTEEVAPAITTLVPDYPSMTKEKMAIQTIHGQIWTDVLKQNMTELRRLPYDSIRSVFAKMIPGFSQMYSQDFQSVRNSRGDTKAIEWLLWKLQTSAFPWHNALLEVLRQDESLSYVINDCFNQLHNNTLCPCQTERQEAKVALV